KTDEQVGVNAGRFDAGSLKPLGGTLQESLDAHAYFSFSAASLASSSVWIAD
ncbi:MAG: hypothetical protein RL009_454, partial [Actinomycetota bacterium]